MLRSVAPYWSEKREAPLAMTDNTAPGGTPIQ